MAKTAFARLLFVRHSVPLILVVYCLGFRVSSLEIRALEGRAAGKLSSRDCLKNLNTLACHESPCNDSPRLRLANLNVTKHNFRLPAWAIRA